MEFNTWNIIWSLSFGFLAALIVVGNALAIFIFLKQKLRKRPHFLLISLSVADLLVGLLTVPLYIAINTSFVVTAPAFNYVDIFTGLTSIFTLAVIALERMCAIGWPFCHRSLSLRAHNFSIVTPWILAAIVTSVQVLRHANVIGRDGSIAVVITSPAVPLLVMCFAYCFIWRKVKSRMGNQNQRMAREVRLTKTLFLIIGASLLAWLPFQILNLIGFFLPSCIQPIAIVHSIKLLQFSNSLVNVIIYPFRILEFKVALFRMFQYCLTPFRSEPRSRSERENNSEGENQSTV